MKNKLISLIIAQIFLLGLLSCNNQKSSDSTSGEASKSEVVPVKSEKAAEPVGTAAFKFEETEFDFGKINKGDVINYCFNFNYSLSTLNIRMNCNRFYNITRFSSTIKLN